MITTKAPNDWRGLQNDVARILRECGFNVEVEKVIQGARGAVEIDVYAEENVRGRKYSIVCECKNWKSRVPQNVIHGFRTVLGDVGANIGYIISTAGFQSGSFNAADLTNVKLVDWSEFQDDFEGSWYDNFFVPEITRRLDPLLRYTEPLLPRWVDELSDEDAEQFFRLKKKYDEFGLLMMTFSIYLRFMNAAKIELPLSNCPPIHPGFGASIPQDILEHTSYREFLEDAFAFGEEGLAQFKAIHDRYVP
ncbi:restriction endonuclease (plasmid) [Azospirillum sp. HJ39]|uniref:restriction endonuclease n=1 Tax=Azospirillum sp. HJ39 TaxID=3159496 RepID=UPI003556D9F1